MVVELFLCPEMLKSTKSFGFFDYKIRTIPTLEPYVVFKDNSFALDFAHLLKINSTLIFHSGTCILGLLSIINFYFIIVNLVEQGTKQPLLR
jgi:hypothetical protein